MTDDERESWYDAEAGPVVRLYALTQGRSRNARPELDIITLVVNVSGGVRPRRPEPEYARILQLSRTPLSIAEVAAQLGLPLNSTKILVSDLIDDRMLEHRSPDQSAEPARDQDLLRRLHRAIRAL
ncbi:DUF742 domain-containing protein [Nocardia alba]|uniref:Uncharacterized protein DUF742 n=1 Tax=Nocardia alba TaxID=225051 RepID=A0A4R1G082_9NOCA|nr:DUF742 domain-containing protein [Nocardia alba]TCJ99489.1 uncharacterized protein DUF742 [Nocardia alba]